MKFSKTLLITATAALCALGSAAQAVPGNDRLMPMDVDARVLSQITSGQQLNARARSSTNLGRYVPGQIGRGAPKSLASDMTQPFAMQAMSGAKIARLRSYAGPQGNMKRRPTEVCNSDVNIGSIVNDDTPQIRGPVRQEVYTGDVTVLNLNRCRSLDRMQEQ